LSILSIVKLNISLKLRQLLPAQPCVLCGSMNHEGLWCKNCNHSLPYLSAPHCPVCALPTLHGEICGHCLTKPPAFGHTVAVFDYRFPLDQLIGQMKYHEQLAIAQAFAEKLTQRIDRIHLPDFVIAMPLHPAKLRSRGFNQAQLLAVPLADYFGISLLSNACQRLRDTASQTSLPWHQRHKNVRGAFSCDRNLSGTHVALVDDVMTTGASLNELASAVKKQGAKKISTWVVARAGK